MIGEASEAAKHHANIAQRYKAELRLSEIVEYRFGRTHNNQALINDLKSSGLLMDTGKLETVLLYLKDAKRVIDCGESLEDIRVFAGVWVTEAINLLLESK